MKKTVIILSAFALIAVSCSKKQQTYYYQAVEFIWDDGKRSASFGDFISTGGEFYMTFVDDKSTCYISDRKGNRTRGYIWHYQKTQNDTLIYQAQYNMEWEDDFCYFSPDFKTLTNTDSDIYSTVRFIVYKRTRGPRLIVILVEAFVSVIEFFRGDE